MILILMANKGQGLEIPWMSIVSGCITFGILYPSLTPSELAGPVVHVRSFRAASTNWPKHIVSSQDTIHGAVSSHHYPTFGALSPGWVSATLLIWTETPAHCDSPHAAYASLGFYLLYTLYTHTSPLIVIDKPSRELEIIVMSLNGKIAIVTGGARGIGAGIITRSINQTFLTWYIHNGLILTESTCDENIDVNIVQVAFNYVSPSSEAAALKLVEEVKGFGVRVTCIRADMASPEAPSLILKAALREFQTDKVDILVNNAGVGGNAPLEEVTIEDYDRLMAVNVRAVIFMTQSVLPHINRGGRIVNLSSISARGGYPTQSVYAASKAAVEGLTRVWATELGHKYGVTVNSVNPGPVDTDMYRAAGPVHLARMEEQNKKVPAEPRCGTDEDVADIIVFLYGIHIEKDSLELFSLRGIGGSPMSTLIRYMTIRNFRNRDLERVTAFEIHRPTPRNEPKWTSIRHEWLMLRYCRSRRVVLRELGQIKRKPIGTSSRIKRSKYV
ncbi:uncharacterized protein CLUP02_09403 [Colletotrichum lupini]|uniref:Uncharacterized protein n=1 Tax=Colletotrichum lupini TaxID=145971 RepID=A0A9Q8SUP1_9PEZI|nr:uncharacterized protein CLUP02_09403 [Colletotrichum lupini]UQC83907.1 hypothetical protein CLUP02_09403 [Colletotrichum lupini]